MNMKLKGERTHICLLNSTRFMVVISLNRDHSIYLHRGGGGVNHIKGRGSAGIGNSSWS